MQLLVFVGNSSILLAGWDPSEGEPPELLLAHRCAWRERAERSPGSTPEDELAELLRRIAEPSPRPSTLLASVRPDRLAAFEALYRAVLPSPRRLAEPFPGDLPSDCEAPAAVGLDRRLNALAVARRWPGEAVAVVDFGTALSISVVSSEGRFAGGLIAAGPAGVLGSILRETPALPAIDRLEPSEAFTERSTPRAIGSGVYWQLLGGAERMIEGLRAEYPGLRVVGTGGALALFREALRGLDHELPFLTLEGLARAGARSLEGT